MLLVECGREHLAEREYVVQVFMEVFLGIEHRLVEGDGHDIVIRQAEDDGRRLLIRDVLFRTAPVLLDEAALPQGVPALLAADQVPGATLLGDLPVLYGDGTVSVDGDTIELGADVFGGAFVMLTRLEEALPGARDVHDRFAAGSSLAYRHGFLDRPLANEYAELLWWALARLWPRLERRERSFRVLPSHDVDWPFTAQGLLHEGVAAVRDAVVRRDLGSAKSRLRAAVELQRGGRDVDPLNTFDFLMRQSELQGYPSAFYFMTRHVDRRFDGDYSIDDPWIRNLLREIGSRGHEIGLHPSYTTYRDETGLQLELDRLTRACRQEGLEQERFGGRQHFLRWANPVTWRQWNAAGLAYDSTLGFADAVGFRCGSCYEFPVFDLEERRTMELVERPLVAMEGSLLQYGGASLEQAVLEMRRMKETCRVFDGDFTLLWHNSQLQTVQHQDAYVAVLEP